jgi:hypothetical protein
MAHVIKEETKDSFFKFGEDKLKSLPENDALELLEKLKAAVTTKDPNAIDQVCKLLDSRTVGTELNSTVSDACRSMFSEKKSSVIIRYTTPTNFDIPLTQSIIVTTDGSSTFDHAFIYVDDIFEGFHPKEIEYMVSLGINNCDIINPSTGKVIYTGLLNPDVAKPENIEMKEGWMILIGVIIFIGAGLLIKSKMN